MLISDLINVRYLSGFSGSNGALLVFADERDAVLATDGRYRTQAASQAPDLEVAIERAVGRYLAGRAGEAGVGKLGFESHVVTVDGLDALAGALEGKNTELVRASGTVESLREVKDAGELALLRLACEAADAALTDLVSRGGRPDLAGDSLGSVVAPTLLIVGGRDQVVLELNQRAQAVIPGKCQLTVVPGATHLFEEPGTLEQVAKLACDWFIDHLCGPGPSG